MTVLLSTWKMDEALEDKEWKKTHYQPLKRERKRNEGIIDESI